MTSALDSRYGRTRGRSVRARTIAIVAGAGVLAVTVAWVVWVGLFGVTASIDTQDVGYVVVDRHTIDVKSQISTDPHTAVTCSIQALNEKFAIVGWRIVEFPALDARNRTVTERVHTSEPAVTGAIGSCWVS